jgi:hypothetical protein
MNPDRTTQRHVDPSRADRSSLLALDVETDNCPFGVEIGVHPGRDLARFRAGLGTKLDIETVGLRIIMQLHHGSSRKFRSKKALCTVSPSSSVTTLASERASKEKGRSSGAAL